jgi:hypothetical protein
VLLAQEDARLGLHLEGPHRLELVLREGAHVGLDRAQVVDHLGRDRRDDPGDLLRAEPEALRGPVVEFLGVVPDGVVAPLPHVLDDAGDHLGHLGSVFSQRRGGRCLLQLPAHLVLQITSGSASCCAYLVMSRASHRMTIG